MHSPTMVRPVRYVPVQRMTAFTPIHRAGAQHHGADVSVLAADLRYLRLPQRQVLLLLQRVLHHLLVAPAVGLRPQRPHGGAFGAVEHPVLDAGTVCRPGHFAAQCVQLPDEVSLTGAADGGVAGHVAHRVQINGKADGAHAQPRRWPAPPRCRRGPRR